MSQADADLDDLDRKILDIIQTSFPIVSRPYGAIAQKLGAGEEDIFRRVERMRASGIIRRLGANFQSGHLGFVSTLCAASVPAEKLEAFVSRVNSEKGVTHNYERDHPWNIWFTLIAPSREAAKAILQDISRETGVEILNLPASRMFKIRVDFPMQKSE